jgi:membrane protein insertase Oxa1/YidC/SpoIIIJ
MDESLSKPLESGDIPPSPAPVAQDPLKLAAFQFELIARAVPALKPPGASYAVTIPAVALLLIAAWLGKGPLASLKAPSETIYENFGKPLEADMDVGFLEYREERRGDDLALRFDGFGDLKSILTRAPEGPKPEDWLELLDDGKGLGIRAWNDDDARGELERVRELRLDPDGFAKRSTFFYDELRCDTIVTLGRDENGATRRYLDITIDFENTGRERLSFNYRIDGLRGFQVSDEDLVSGQVAATALSDPRSKGRSIDRLTGEELRGTGQSSTFQGAWAVGIASSRALIALISNDSFNGRQKAEISTERMGFGSDGINTGIALIREALELETKQKLRHHFRLVIGANSPWTLAGLSGPEGQNLSPLRSDAFLRSAEDFMERGLFGLQSIIRNPGLAVMALALLLALALRPWTLRNEWHRIRMAMVQPFFEAIDELRTRTSTLLDSAEDKKTLQKMAAETIARMRRENALPGCSPGCLFWIAIVVLASALHGVVHNSIATRGASFLWAQDLTQPDALITFEEPLLSIDFTALRFSEEDRESLPPAIHERFIWRIKALNVFAIILYLVPWIETLLLWRMGVPRKISWFWTPIRFALYMVLFYNDGAGMLLAFTVVYSIWVFDRLAIMKYIMRGGDSADSENGDEDEDHGHPSGALQPELNSESLPPII